MSGRRRRPSLISPVGTSLQTINSIARQPLARARIRHRRWVIFQLHLSMYFLITLPDIFEVSTREKVGEFSTRKCTINQEIARVSRGVAWRTSGRNRSGHAQQAMHSLSHWQAAVLCRGGEEERSGYAKRASLSLMLSLSLTLPLSLDLPPQRKSYGEK